MMKKKWFYIALLSLLLSGCGAKSNVIQKYQPEKNTKLKYSLLTTPQVEVPDAVLETMRSQIQESLSARNLLAMKGDVKFNKADILITKYRMRPDAARLLLGMTAGCDTIKSKATVVDSNAGIVVGESEFESLVCAAWGVSAQVIEAHIKEITDYLTGDLAAIAGDELSATEVTKLFSGKTVEGVNVKKENVKPYKAYFNPDGTIQAKHWYGKKHLKWKKRNGKWWIDDKGRICVKWEDQDKKKCMVIEKEGEIYRQYRIKNDGSRKHVATFKKFTEGNPDDL
jgi:hypothetical protein